MWNFDGFRLIPHHNRPYRGIPGHQPKKQVQCYWLNFCSSQDKTSAHSKMSSWAIFWDFFMFEGAQNTQKQGFDENFGKMRWIFDTPCFLRKHHWNQFFSGNHNNWWLIRRKNVKLVKIFMFFSILWFSHFWKPKSHLHIVITWPVKKLHGFARSGTICTW